ncbi:MAG: site-2 protease family protein [Bacilli bacterium]
MKNIYHKIEFHYTYLIMALGFVLTGHFINLIVLTSLILFHEMGHYLASKIFKYKVDKIIIYPYGGMTKLDTIVNTRIRNDIIVAISGSVFQIIYFIIIYLLYINNLIRDQVYNLFEIYHKSMLLFNLLPIVPLDGSKIVNLILSKYFSYNMANRITVLISLFTIMISLKIEVFERNYSTILIIFILMKNIYSFYNEIDYIYNRFLLERYLYNFNYKKVKVIDSKNKMYKNKKHFFINNNKIVPEKTYLKEIFKK